MLFDRSVKTYCKSFNNTSLTVFISEWLERHAGKQEVAGSIPDRGVYFRLLPVAHSTAKTIEMKSSMTFIQSNGCREIDLIFFFKYGGGLYYDATALYPALHIERRSSISWKSERSEIQRLLVQSHWFFFQEFTFVGIIFTGEDWSWRIKQGILVWDEILIFSLFEGCLYRKGPALIDRSM